MSENKITLQQMSQTARPDRYITLIQLQILATCTVAFVINVLLPGSPQISSLVCCDSCNKDVKQSIKNTNIY